MGGRISASLDCYSTAGGTDLIVDRIWHFGLFSCRVGPYKLLVVITLPEENRPALLPLLEKEKFIPDCASDSLLDCVEASQCHDLFDSLPRLWQKTDRDPSILSGVAHLFLLFSDAVSTPCGIVLAPNASQQDA